MGHYETDFYRWTQDTSGKLRRGEWAGIDLCALAEEVEDLGKKATIQLQRNRIERLLRGSPSLRAVLPEILPEAYSDAALRAVKEAGLDPGKFSTTCPYSIEAILAGKDISAGF